MRSSEQGAITDSELLVLRKTLTNLALTDMDAVARIKGIEMIERVELRPQDEDCYDYVFGQGGLDVAIARLRVMGIRTDHEAGSIAFYFMNNTLRHVGVVSDRGGVISKWGPDGHVFKHKPHYLASTYGDIKGYYKYPLR